MRAARESKKCTHKFLVWKVYWLTNTIYSHSRCSACGNACKVKAIGPHNRTGIKIIDHKPEPRRGQIELF